MSGLYYCEHCHRRLRTTHDGNSVCETSRCPRNPRTDREDAEAWRVAAEDARKAIDRFLTFEYDEKYLMDADALLVAALDRVRSGTREEQG